MKINVKKSAKRKNMEYLDRLLVFALFLLKQETQAKTTNKEFINDESVIGKWEIINENEFPFNEIYFLPNGQGYWVFENWTKGYLKIDDVYHKYEVKNNQLPQRFNSIKVRLEHTIR